ncbi:neprilysin-1-like [Rhipicephalus microplus]|uniref:neprilysin-1-like n=1 Tax=Rhipicephalus microplus TaxID=6941 RepID=UPI003F6C43D8
MPGHEQKTQSTGKRKGELESTMKYSTVGSVTAPKDASKNWGELFPEPEGMQSATMSRIRMKRIQVIIIVAATTLFIACTTLLLFLLWAFTRPAIQFCNTRDCLRHILELKEAMNTSVNPCEDFYQFTCGTWKLHHREKSTVARVFDHSTEIAIKEMQEGSIAKAVVPKALEYFRNCILERDMTPAEAEVFIDFKHQLGLFWPEKPQVAIDALLPLLNMTITWNINLLFHLRALPAYKRRPQTLYIRRGILNTHWLDPKWTPETFAESVKIHCRVLRVEAPSSSSIQELKNTVEDIIDAALKVPPDATSDTQFKLKQIEVLMPNRTDDWLKHLNILHSPQFTWTLDSPVALEDNSILQNLNALQQKYKDKKQVLLEGFAFVFIRTTLWLFAKKPEIRYGTNPEHNRNFWKRACLSYTTANFGLLVAVQHIYSRYTSSVRADLQRFHHSIQEALKQQIEDAAWIDETIKNKVTVKIDDLTLNAMPEENFFSDVNLARLYRDFPTIGLSFISNFIAVATAFRLLIGHDSFISVYSKQLGGGAPNRYNYYYNIAYMSLGAMEPPILYLDGTMAMMYGSFGTLIAECLVRSFDKRGVLVNELGKSEHWWNSPAYTQRVSCDFLSEPKTGGSGAATSSTPPPGSRDPREVRFSALFPLAPALTTSFIAHRKAIATDGYVQRRLHGLDDFDDDQIFFLSYCLTTCAVNSNGETCNVPLRQMNEFANAFQCEPDSPMNPQKKCKFFE